MRIKKFFATTLSISLLMLLSGIAAYLVLGGVEKSKQMLNKFEVAIYFSDSVTHDQICAVEQQLVNDNSVADSRIVSKVDAAKEFADAIGIKVGDKNPLPASIRVKLKPNANVDHFEMQVAKIKGVEDVDYPKQIVSQVQENLKVIWYFVAGFCVIMFVVVLILFRNVIRMDVAASSEAVSEAVARKIPINAIRQPFTLRAFTQGAIAGTIACVFLFLFTSGIATIYPFTQLPIDISLMFVIFASMMLCSMLLGWLFAYLAVGAQIKNR